MYFYNFKKKLYYNIIYIMSKYDKIHRPKYNYDSRKLADLFSIINNMNTDELTRMNIIHKIPLTVTDNDGNNLIHYVLKNSDPTKTEFHRLNVIKFLFNQNVNPDAPNSENMTPLHFACMKQYKDIINYLIDDIGVNYNYQDNMGNTGLHYLLAGIIKENKDDSIKSLVPLQEKKDINREKLWLETRKEIWELIKNSEYLDAIKNTINKSISDSKQSIKIAIDFEEDLVKENLDPTSRDNMDRIKLFLGAYINRFRKIIDSEWKNFQKIKDIRIHEKQITSYPGKETNMIRTDELPIKQGIIQNANINLRIKKNIENEKTILIEQLNDVNFNDTNDIDYDSAIIDLRDDLVGSGNPLTLANIDANYEEYLSKWNNMQSKLVIDEVDNIIDVVNKIFIGGARQFEIVLNIDHTDKTNGEVNDLVSQILTNNNYVNDLVNDGDDIDISIQRYIANYILSLCSDSTVSTSDFIEYENSLLENFDSLTSGGAIVGGEDSYQLIMNMIMERSKYIALNDQKRYIYTLFCKYKLANTQSHLIGNISRWEMYLFAGFFNYQTNLKLSISQAARIELIKDSNDKKYFATWIDRLLTDKSLNDDTNSTNNDLQHIRELVNEYILSKKIWRTNRDITQKLSKIDMDEFDKYSSCEVIVACIINYYNKMTQKPLIQHLVDTISLLRYHYITDLDNEKLQSLYTDELTFANTNGDMLDQYNIGSISKLDKTILIDIKEEYKNIFGDNMDSNLIEQLTEFQLPSMINFYICHNNLMVEDERKHNILKMIESRLLGFNFIGTIPTIEFIENDNAGINIDVNFFNFTNNNLDNTNRYYNLDVNTIYLHKPPIDENICNLLIESSNKLIELFNTTSRYIIDYMTNFEATRKSKTYGKLITYLMPVLNAISSQIRTYQGLLGNTNCPNRINISYNSVSFKSTINKINGLLFLFYYMNQDEIKIPAFIYDQLNEYPLVKLFYNDNGEMVFPNDDNIDLDVIDGTGRPVNIGNIPIQGYNSIVNQINSNNYFLVSKIIKDNYKQNKNKTLPPSLKILLSNFYEYNTIDLIKTTLENNDFNIDDKLLPKNVSEKVKNITKYSMISKIIEELVRRYLNNYIYEVGVDIFNKVIKSEKLNFSKFKLEQMFDMVPFDVELNKELSDSEKNYINSIGTKPEESYTSFYKFYEDPIIKEKNYVYPDDYNRLNQLNLLYYIKVNEDIIDSLSGVNIYLNNNENENAIFNLLKFRNHNILQKIKDKYNISYNDNFKTNNGDTLIEYIDNEISNHKSKFTNNMVTQSEQIKHFVNTQFEDIKYIILSNEAFGNNIPKFLELSYSICNYISQQYLYEKINTFDPTNTFYSKFSNVNQKDYIYLVDSSLTSILEYGPQVLSELDIINRYNQLNYSPYTYLYGWQQVLTDITDSNENIIQNNFDNKEEMKKIKELSKEYFINGKYNDINLFTRKLLIHLTQKVICSTIEIIIRKVLLAQLQDQEDYKNKEIMIDYMFNREDPSGESLIDILNNNVAIDLVQSIVGMFESKKDKNQYTPKETDDILYGYIDSLETLSPIPLSEYTVKVLKNNIVKYLGTIIPKIIQNWKITSENVYLFSINQYNLLECKDIINL